MKKNINLIAKLDNLNHILDLDMCENFKSLLENNSLIIEFELYEKISKNIPKCQTIIFCKDPNKIHKGCYSVSNIETGINIANKKIYAAGGAEFYKLIMPLCHNLYINRDTRIPPGQTLFPDINNKKWKLISSEINGGTIEEIYNRI